MILLLLLVEVMVQCLFCLIYMLLLTQLIMLIFLNSRKHVRICGNANKLIKSYFSNRVQIDNVLSDFANIICGVPQDSVLGPEKCGLYLLPLL